MGKAKKPHSKDPPTPCPVPFVAPRKNKNSSTSLQRCTASPKLLCVGMDSTSATPSSLSLSDSETEEIGSNKFADFVPMSLPPGTGVVSRELQVSFRETLDVMTKVDFSSLAPDKSLKWNLTLSETCLRFSKEITQLQHQLFSLQDTNNKNAESHKRDAFAKFMYPFIKKHCHKVFTRMVFPSKLEVTMTMGTALCGFGLTSTCALASYIFDEIVFKQHGTSARDIICVDDQSSHCRHPFDTP